MVLKLFPDTIFLLKVDHFKRILNQIKIDRMGNDHSNSSNTLKIYTNVTKDHLQFLATPTSTTTDAMTLKIFADTIR